MTSHWPPMTYFCIAFVPKCKWGYFFIVIVNAHRPMYAYKISSLQLQPFRRYKGGPKFKSRSPPPVCGRIRTPEQHNVLGPPGVFTPNSIWICSDVFAQWSWVEPHDRQTDGQTSHTSVIIGCIKCTQWSLIIICNIKQLHTKALLDLQNFSS